MHPEIIPGWPLHSYGLMLVIGFYSAYFLARRTANREGIDPNRMVDVLLIGAVLGIVGSRTFYVIQYNEQIKGFVDLFAIWKGGLVLYGGLIAAGIGVLIYFRVKKLPSWKFADAAAPAIMLGLAFGKIGCFLNGCCWGARCDETFPLAVRFPKFISSTADAGCRQRQLALADVQPDGKWHIDVLKGAPAWVNSRPALIRYVSSLPDNQRVIVLMWSRATWTPDGELAREAISGSYTFLDHLARYPDEIGPQDNWSLPVHPAQLYMSFMAFVICGLLLLYRRWRRRPGEVFAMMGVLYPAARFMNEALRGDRKPALCGLTITQTVSVAAFLVATVAVVWCRLHRRAG